MDVVNVIFNMFPCLRIRMVFLIVVMNRNAGILEFVKRYMMTKMLDATMDSVNVNQCFNIIKIMQHVNFTTKKNNRLEQNVTHSPIVQAVLPVPPTVIVNVQSAMFHTTIIPVNKQNAILINIVGDGLRPTQSV